MNTLTEVPAVSAETLEHVLGTGDLGKLTTPQRVEYYRKTCESLGLNPLTRPIRFLALNGQIQLYFTRDGTDQLRKANGITLHVVDKVVEAGVYAVTVRARDKHGREDEDVGAVALPAGGESRANALMKAITKAKRRVTLSICGLGHTDESELDTMPGARVFDADEEPPVTKIRTLEHDAREAINAEIPLKAAAADMAQGERVVGTKDYGTAEDQAPKPKRTDEQWTVWLSKLKTACGVYRKRSELDEVVWRPAFIAAKAEAPPNVLRDIDSILAAAYERLPAEPILNDPLLGGDLPDVEIAGSEKIAAG